MRGKVYVREQMFQQTKINEMYFISFGRVAESV